MHNMKYIIYREDKYYVSQCLNVDISSFGETIEEAKKNLKEAVELYFEDEDVTPEYHNIEETLIGEMDINV